MHDLSNQLIVLADKFSDAQRERIEEAAPRARFSAAALDASELPQEAAVVIGTYRPAVVSKLEHLRLLQLTSAGYATFLRPGILPDRTVLATASGAFDQAVSEHMLASLLGLLKKLPAYRDAQEQGEWTDFGPVGTLDGAKVLVIGAGHIGQAFGRLCAALGARVTGVARHRHAVPQGFERMTTMDHLAELVPRFPIIASVLPSSPQTQKIYDGKFFESCRSGTFFVNAGRGDAVDRAALRTALESGHLAGAALDVTDPEPLPKDDPLWQAPNILITPHVAGGWHLAATGAALTSLAIRNLKAWQEGRPLENQISR